jgi:hypothetical protein
MTMGIELPAELRDVAARAGARWPEADEDAMRRSASAWRDAAKSVTGLARDADSTAHGALSAMQGPTSDAARRQWSGFVGEGGQLPRSVRECTAAADRLDHAADQIGAAKVQMVRELVSLAKNTGAAEKVAAAGNPQALAGMDTVVRGASANLAQLHSRLASAVDIDSGVTMESGSPSRGQSAGTSASAVPGAGALGSAGSLGGSGAGKAASTVDGHDALAGSASRSVGEIGSAAHDLTGGGTRPDAVTGSGHSVLAGDLAEHGPTITGAAGAHPGWHGGGESTGPVSAETVGGGRTWSPGTSDAGTGPIPVVGGESASRGTGWPSSSEDPASSTAPHTVHAAWAAPVDAAPAGPGSAPRPGFTPGASPQTYAPSGPGGGQFFAPSSGGPAPGGGGFGASVPGATPPHQAAPRPPVGAPPRQEVFGAPASRDQQQPVQRGPMGQPVRASTPSEAPPRPLRQGDRNDAAVAFVLHQFPIGYMPVAAVRASRQMPLTPELDHARGRRFRPQDHPQSSLVEDTNALARVRANRARVVADDPDPVPEELVAHHRPFGELNELEWERTYLARPGANGTADGYVWPPAEQFPEGGVEPGEPVVLEPDTVLDRFGDSSGWVLAPRGTVFAQRCLPPTYRDREYRRYRVTRPLPVWQAVSAPWFAQPGGGVRYRTTYPVADLIALGHLVEVTSEREAAEAPTLRIDTAHVTAQEAQR